MGGGGGPQREGSREGTAGEEEGAGGRGEQEAAMQGWRESGAYAEGSCKVRGREAGSCFKERRGEAVVKEMTPFV